MGKRKKEREKKTSPGSFILCTIKDALPSYVFFNQWHPWGNVDATHRGRWERKGKKFGFIGWPSEAFWSPSVWPVQRGCRPYVSHALLRLALVCVSVFPRCISYCKECTEARKWIIIRSFVLHPSELKPLHTGKGSKHVDQWISMTSQWPLNDLSTTFPWL